MPTVDIMDLADQRLLQIRAEDPEAIVRDTYFEGESGVWCLITVESEIDLRYEFLESAESWRRPDAITNYNDAVIFAPEIYVIVPESVFTEVLDMVFRRGNPGILVTDYLALGIQPTPLVS